jgi:enoyl-CoA hydratase
LAVQELQDGVLRVAFNRPERRNAITQVGHRELVQIWREIDLDNRVRAVILTGNGKDYSAGGEIALLDQMIEDADLREQVWRDARELVYNIVNCSKPIVSSMRGVVSGAPLAAGLLADISVAARDASLLDAHVKLGIAAGDHGVLWPLFCGMARAKYHLLLSEPITGADAYEIGLVSRAVEESELDETALAIAQRLADSSRSAVSWTKYALNNWFRSAGPIFDTSLALEIMGFANSDIREGILSHRQKRKPDFRSRDRQ